jgi:hypothetical protein
MRALFDSMSTKKSNKETSQKKDIGINMSFLPLFNIVKSQIGWKWVNKKRKIITRADKEF